MEYEDIRRLELRKQINQTKDEKELQEIAEAYALENDALRAERDDFMEENRELKQRIASLEMVLELLH